VCRFVKYFCHVDKSVVKNERYFIIVQMGNCQVFS
jgi:hypothetical protein